MKFFRCCLAISALGIALVSPNSFSQMYQGLRGQCKDNVSCIRDAAEKETISRASTYFKYAYKENNGEDILVKDLCYAGGKMPANQSNYRYKDVAQIYPSVDCEGIAKAIFEKWSAELDAQEVASKEKRRVAQQEEQRKAIAQQQAEDDRVAALKAGQVKPASLKEAAIVYNAEHGGSLASAPKIRPDGAMYYMNGKIKMAGDRPEFLAALSSSQDNELLVNALRRSRGMGESTDYFAVVIPNQLQKYYFDGAKIEGGFDLVGRYVSNTKYKTVAGQEKTAPVFEAVYFVLWK
jgi:hypothetical protein